MIFYDFGLSVREYAHRGKKNDFPEVDICPHCKGHIRLLRHGFYNRNTITNNNIFYIPICRLKCPFCGKTVSLIPSFLFPYLQHTITTILVKLKNFFCYRKFTGYRQLIEFLSQRFMKNLLLIEIFFRDIGFRGVFPFKLKEKAIKLVEMLLAFAKPPSEEGATDIFRLTLWQINSILFYPPENYFFSVLDFPSRLIS
ncbi:DUF6431 domain-containing protein [Carboxydothermus islandicus]|uniref:DUF6431 domain-containing protein n=1 Tax=Carboxydothermus islandicus TaxID=661089 RepID=UPI002684EB72